MGKEAKPSSTPPDAGSMDAAKGRMENSILDHKAARATCPTCGAHGNWRVDCTRGRIRHLVCKACGVGRIHVAVTDGEVASALAAAPVARPTPATGTGSR